MTPADNKAVVRRFLDEVVGQGPLDLTDELCAPDLINHAVAPERQHGVENVKAVLGFSLGAQPDQRWVERYLLADDDLGMLQQLGAI